MSSGPPVPSDSPRRARSQSRPQAPGPPECGQERHGPDGSAALSFPLVLETAKTDSFFSSFLPPQCGQTGRAEPWIRVSNSVSQERQRYSYIGIVESLASNPSFPGIAEDGTRSGAFRNRAAHPHRI